MLYSNYEAYRHKITPWHETLPVCWFFIIFSTVVFLFSLAGINVAGTTPAYIDYLWLPMLLAGLSLYIIIRVLIRIVKKNGST